MTKTTTTTTSGAGAAETAKSAIQTPKKSTGRPMATIGETLHYVFVCGPLNQVLFVCGCLGGIANGLVYPILAYVFSNSFSDISAAHNQGLSQIRDLAFTFLELGVYALVAATIQSACLEFCAYHAAHRFRLEWFQALLRQDAAYFDVHNVNGIAQQVGPHANTLRRGLGRKFGEGIQFGVTGVGGIVFSFYTSWRVALVVLTVIPVVSLAALSVVQLNQTKGTRAAAAYKQAGSVAYTAVSSIKTVLSLNAIPEMMRQYQAATSVAFQQATAILFKQGFANGAMLSSFLGLYCVLTLYGSSLFYKDVKAEGCDPSAAITDNATCEQSGPDVFGAMLGIAFASQGISQFGNFSEAFTQARVAVYEALKTIRRIPGQTPAETIYKNPHLLDDGNTSDELNATTRSTRSNRSKKNHTNHAAANEPVAEPVVHAILPKYEIDATSTTGIQPHELRGEIHVHNVHFRYPTRPSDPIVRNMNVSIPAGQTVAFVGPSGHGKSTIVSLLERFYDPWEGAIELDGVNLKEYNVGYLRRQMGYVGQEPTLFATTIRANIRYGNPSATDEQIEQAARMANAHDFISSFTDGYDTQVGDKGSQLSGGQKQRIAIARVLVGQPRILLLDEATSALDAESELVVQDALDHIIQEFKMTTIIIAHRLSTIRNADVIHVIYEGQVVESGNHEHLMSKQGYYYRLVQKQEGHHHDPNEATASTSSVSSSLAPSSRASSATDLGEVLEPAVSSDEEDVYTSSDNNVVSSIAPVHLEFRHVQFAYPTRPKKIIFKDFNLKIHQGETVALVGPSGGGKSTTVGLIERFYDPLHGHVFYHGNDIKALNVSWYRDQIGYVGQEPTLFNDTIGKNIAYGFPGATQAQIEEAARASNAHDFIMSFPEGYDTPVGERGTQLSGGQKQRIAIARALVKKPKLLILDEATSALDNESEAIVQEAIDKLIQAHAQTVVVIAHRLSTIRKADKIAYISHGKVQECGTHDELVNKEHGHYKRLFASSQMNATVDNMGKKAGDKKADEEEEEEGIIDWEAQMEAEVKKFFDGKRARDMARPDAFYMMVGGIGAIMAGGVFPMWGLLFSETIELLFRPVLRCPDDEGVVPEGFSTCETYWSTVSNDIQHHSFRVAIFWLVVMFGGLMGNILNYWGFGMASERMSKRIRDSTFTALLRQEPAYFDKRSVGSITSQLQDDAARIQAFSGEPVRQLLTAVASVVIGVVLSFVFMWQFALLAIACVPFMKFAASMKMKQMMGEDLGDTNAVDGLGTPGGIVVETLLNIRTVSALTMEQQRFKDYEQALLRADANYKVDAFMDGLNSGLAVFIQQWINALQMFFGGYLLFTYPETYEFRDFLIANFAVLFSLFGLGTAFQDITDRKEVEQSIGRVFYLLDLDSKIDPLAEHGKRLEFEDMMVPHHPQRPELLPPKNIFEGSQRLSI